MAYWVANLADEASNINCTNRDETTEYMTPTWLKKNPKRHFFNVKHSGHSTSGPGTYIGAISESILNTHIKDELAADGVSSWSGYEPAGSDSKASPGASTDLKSNASSAATASSSRSTGSTKSTRSGVSQADASPTVRGAVPSRRSALQTSVAANGGGSMSLGGAPLGVRTPVGRRRVVGHDNQIIAGALMHQVRPAAKSLKKETLDHTLLLSLEVERILQYYYSVTMPAIVDSFVMTAGPHASSAVL